METSNSDCRPLIVAPPDPITAPIFSWGTLIVVIFGAYLETSLLTSEIVDDIWSNICSLAILAFSKACSIISKVIPLTFISIWRAVTPSFVPATLKSISPIWSSAPCISVSTTNFPLSSVISPIAIPATGEEIGTPASINASEDEQTDAIEVEPLEDKASDTDLIV